MIEESAEGKACEDGESMRFTMNQKSPDRESPNRSESAKSDDSPKPRLDFILQSRYGRPTGSQALEEVPPLAFLFVQPLLPADFLFQKHFAPTASGIASLPESDPASETRLQNAASRA